MNYEPALTDDEEVPDTSGIVPNDPQAIAESLFPLGDTKKGRYLALRACGFKFREACRLTPVNNTTVWEWRKTASFSEMEKSALNGLRDKLIKEHLTIEFTRNYVLVLMKDHQVLRKTLESPELTKQEQEYLLKARSHYTPQQLQILKELAMLGEKAKEGNWADFVARITRTETFEVREGR